MTKNYAQAFTEVYEILRYLEEESYQKIPKEIIKVIQENRNKEYDYSIDESIPFQKQEMLKETKAILCNFYRDYLATPKEKKNMIQKQKEAFLLLEEEKRKKYNPEGLFHKKR